MIKVSTGSIDIRYPGEMIASGHSSDKSIRNNYDGSVEVNFIVLISEDIDIYLIQIDTLYVDNLLKNNLQKRFKRSGVPVELICVSSHSHSLPGIDPSKKLLGDYYEKYLNFIEQKIINEINIHLKDLKTEDVFFSNYKTFSQLSIGRRGSKSKKNFSLFNLRNTVPDFSELGANIELTCFFGEHCKDIIAIIWTFPAHPVLYPNNDKFSADFPGHVRKLLRRDLGNDQIPILYLPGCTGDRRPMLQSKIRQKNILDLIVGQPFEEWSIEEYFKYCESLKSEIYKMIVDNKNRHKTQLVSASYKSVKIPLEDIGITNQFEDSLIVELLSFNTYLKYAFLNCEPSYKYHNLFGKECTVTGYSSGVFGYLPTDTQVSEGGYEVDGFMSFFHTSGKFYKPLEKTINDRVRNEHTINKS